MKLLKSYGEISNFKMHPSKSEILNINVRKQDVQIFQQEFPFIWREKELKYLRVKITPSEEITYQTNFIPLLIEIKTEINKTATGYLSWIGRINIFKMAILPKITKCKCCQFPSLNYTSQY